MQYSANITLNILDPWKSYTANIIFIIRCITFSRVQSQRMLAAVYGQKTTGQKTTKMPNPDNRPLNQ